MLRKNNENNALRLAPTTITTTTMAGASIMKAAWEDMDTLQPLQLLVTVSLKLAYTCTNIRGFAA
jgi:hypothetical protein